MDESETQHAASDYWRSYLLTHGFGRGESPVTMTNTGESCSTAVHIGTNLSVFLPFSLDDPEPKRRHNFVSDNIVYIFTHLPHAMLCTVQRASTAKLVYSAQIDSSLPVCLKMEKGFFCKGFYVTLCAAHALSRRLLNRHAPNYRRGIWKTVVPPLLYTWLEHNIRYNTTQNGPSGTLSLKRRTMSPCLSPPMAADQTLV